MRQNEEKRLKENNRLKSKNEFDKILDKRLTFKPKINKKSKQIMIGKQKKQKKQTTQRQIQRQI